ncbi:NAD(P)-binding protein [Cadophora sp. DSE1049]|nr:NAD(P)-binding protein [Cadophora sp. DSE1049]
MSSKLIFITGATGFIGAATASAGLKAGYRLRFSVRKDSQISKLKGTFSEYADKIEFVIVPDITAPNAFSNVLDGVDYVLHLASPIAGSIKKEEMFPPALEGTLSILRSAKEVVSIKKVVITSSSLALEPLDGVPEGGVLREDNGWDLSVDTNANFVAGNDMLTSFKLYAASKLIANNASWEFAEKEKPGFELFTIHPSLVYGSNLVQQSAKEVEGSSNGLLLGSIMGGAISDSPLFSVYVGDVADAHIKCLDDSATKGTKYLVSGRPYTWKDIVGILEKDYPGVPHKLDKDKDSFLKKADTSRVERELGIKWTAPEKMIKEVLDQQLAYLK